MKGDDDKQTARSGKSDPIAKKLEKKGAAPPDKTTLTLDKTNTSKSYTTKKATMIDDTVQTSASNGGGDIDLPPGVTSTPMQPSRHILAPATLEHGGEAETSRLEDKDTLIDSGNLQVLQVPGMTVGEKTIKTAKGKDSRLIASDASSQGSVERTKRTRGDIQQIAEGKTLELRVSKKQKKKDAPDSRRGRGRGGAAERRGSIVVQAEVSKLNRKEAKAAKLADDKAKIENASKSKRSDTERYIALQADKSGYIVPEVLDQGPPGGGDSSDPGSDSDKATEENSRIDSVLTTLSQAKEYKKHKSFLTKNNVKLLSKSNKDGTMKETIINRIQLLMADVPTTFRKYKTDYRDQDKPNLEEAFYCLEDREKNLKEKACCVQSVTTYLAKSWEKLLDLLAV
jgi:hypothetical protein